VSGTDGHLWIITHKLRESLGRVHVKLLPTYLSSAAFAFTLTFDNLCFIKYKVSDAKVIFFYCWIGFSFQMPLSKKVGHNYLLTSSLPLCFYYHIINDQFVFDITYSRSRNIRNTGSVLSQSTIERECE
jgi:hypothetical protein